MADCALCCAPTALSNGEKPVCLACLKQQAKSSQTEAIRSQMAFNPEKVSVAAFHRTFLDFWFGDCCDFRYDV